jgi:DNA-binding XRE family transcriptional regulator
MDTITLTTQEYQDIIDARDHAMAMRDVATGAMETLTEAEVTAYLEASSPLAFWRHHRGLSQSSLAGAAGISQPYLAQIETGKRVGDVNLYAKFAKTLNVKIEDLIPAT